MLYSGNARFLAIVLAAALLPACAGKRQSASNGGTDRVTQRQLPEEGLVVQEIDFDGDGQIEVRNFLRQRADAPDILVRKEVDLNRDGRVDVVSFFDDAGALEKEEMDSDYDGSFDWTDHYKDGHRMMSEWDSDFDGKPNVYKYYAQADGVVYLDRKERDTDGDGRIDMWERFDREGQVTRTGRDTNGDGKMDLREE